MDDNLNQILARLYDLDVTCRLENGRLLLDGPKEALTAGLIATLKANKTHLIAFLSGLSFQEDYSTHIPIASRDTPPPLSFAQQRLWFLEQLETSGSTYHIPLALRLSGRTDINVLTSCLHEITVRHEALRTVFRGGDNGPRQHILPAGKTGPTLVDLSQLSDPTVAAQPIVQAESIRLFDLEGGPLSRNLLLRLQQREHLLLITQHHIVSDGWSLGVLLKELSVLYQAFLQGKESPLPNPPIQYADFAVWQSRRLVGDLLTRQRAFWRNQLSGIPDLIELPWDHPRPQHQTFRGGTEPFQLNASIYQDLANVCRQERTTLFMSLAAGFAALLSRYSRQDDLVIGTPVANRQNGELESLIGFFVNTLALRCSLFDKPTFRSLLVHLRQRAETAFTNQDIPFEQVVECLSLERRLDRSPVFQVMLILQNTPLEPMQLPGVHIDLEPLETQSAKFDLTLNLIERNGLIQGVFEYNCDLFKSITIRRMADQLGVLIEAMTKDPDAQWRRVELLDAPTRQLLLEQWSHNGAQAIRNEPIPLWFDAVTKRFPDAISLQNQSHQFDYRELSRASDIIAETLAAQGVRPGQTVGLCHDYSFGLLAGLMGILKCGGVLLPLDRNLPKQRCAFMLEDTEAVAVVTARPFINDLPERRPAVIFTDEPGQQKPINSTMRSAIEDNGQAYLIYTSGSTGKPKAVSTNHRELSNIIGWGITFLQLDTQTRVLRCLSYAFDFGLFELLTTILAGGRMHFLAPTAMADPKQFEAEANNNRINTIHCTPTFMAGMFAADARFLYLERLHFGGETLTQGIVETAFHHTGDKCTLYNGYGPTEATINSAIYIIPRRNPHLGRPGIPIGRASADHHLYVVDQFAQLTSPGVTGELWIGGSLAVGYLGRPESTASCFVPDPFGGGSGARLYRSGDLVRFLPDGTLLFLGRLGSQVKLRGYRVELGEIETVLRAQPEIRDAAVLVRGTQEPQLVAYVILRQKSSDEPPSNIRRELAKNLPEYMIPKAFVFLDALPLTPNGKLDHKALPPPEQQPHHPILPRTPIERQLHDLAAEVLSLEQVGVTDDFFALGGHSLLATQLMARVNTYFGTDLPLRTLFEDPTIARLAERVVAARVAPVEDEALAAIIAEVDGLSESDIAALLADAESHTSPI